MACIKQNNPEDPEFLKKRPSNRQAVALERIADSLEELIGLLKKSKREDDDWND